MRPNKLKMRRKTTQQHKMRHKMTKESQNHRMRQKNLKKRTKQDAKQ